MTILRISHGYFPFSTWHIISPSPRYVFSPPKKDSAGAFPNKKTFPATDFSEGQSQVVTSIGPQPQQIHQQFNQPSKVALVVQLCLRGAP